ncbi:MAG: cysteine desulfurase family protein [archaeon]|nr:cysteine desulfurase family protein [archaeon]
MKIIYMDNAATTPVYREVAEEIEKFYLEDYGNPSSTHEMGERARKAIDNARVVIAREIGAKVEEIIFTSGATEANNLAFFGLARANKEKKKIVISSIEHSSIFEICKALKREGYEIVEIPVNEEGFIDLKELEKNIDKNTLFVSIIHANNEIGVLQDLRKIGEICKKKGALFHTDAVQSFGKEKINVKEMGISLLSVCGHKIGGMKGIGFLYVENGIEIEPMIYGGGQEKGLRGGTENVPAIAGFAKALEITKKIDDNKIRKIRDYFMIELEEIGGKINGSREKRIAGNVHVSFLGLDADEAVIKLSQKGIMCSTGSACESKRKNNKKVLKAIGLNEKEIAGSLRFSFGENIRRKEVDFVINELGEIVKS